MELAYRYYLFADDGVKRMSKRLLEGLARGADAMPQYAGTKQRYAEVTFRSENGKLSKIIGSRGSFLTFDSDGKVQQSLAESGMRGLEAAFSEEREQRIKAGSVISIKGRLDRMKWQRDSRWELSSEDLDLITADVLTSGKARAKLGQAVGTAARKPPLTYEAREALREIEGKFFEVRFSLDKLTEPALKGLAFDARSRGEDEKDPLLIGLAEAAELRRAILARRRTGRGTWYALVEVIQWDDKRNHGETTLMAHEKCSSKKVAEEVARRLLAEHAHRLAEHVSVEASVITELEWERDFASETT